MAQGAPLQHHQVHVQQVRHLLGEQGGRVSHRIVGKTIGTHREGPHFPDGQPWLHNTHTSWYVWMPTEQPIRVMYVKTCCVIGERRAQASFNSLLIQHY